MAAVTARLMVRGVDLRQMMTEAQTQLTDLADVSWTVTDVQLDPIDQIAGADGMMPLWCAWMTLEADVSA